MLLTASARCLCWSYALPHSVVSALLLKLCIFVAFFSLSKLCLMRLEFAHVARADEVARSIAPTTLSEIVLDSPSRFLSSFICGSNLLDTSSYPGHLVL